MSGSTAFLLTGFFSLTLVAFLDNARGPILPVLCKELGIPYEIAGLFLTIGCITAVVSTFVLGRCLRRWGERRVTIVSCLVSTLPGWFAPLVNSQTRLLLLGALMGIAVAIIGSLCSILTMLGSPPEQRGRIVALQHASYGLGSMAAPLLFQALFARQAAWWFLLTTASLAFIGLALWSYLTLPATPAASELSSSKEAQISPRSYLVIAMFAVYVAGEVLASMWMPSLLVNRHSKSPAEAASYLTWFFVILAATRFMCFLFLKTRWERPLLLLCLACAVLFGLLGQQGWSWALPAMGILGPFFPIAMSRMSLSFPDSWKQMTIAIYAAIQSSLALMHISVGKMADTLDLSQAFLLSPVLLALAAGFFYFSSLQTRSVRSS